MRVGVGGAPGPGSAAPSLVISLLVEAGSTEWRAGEAAEPVLEPRWRSHQEEVGSTELASFLLTSSFRRSRNARVEEPTVPAALAPKSSGRKKLADVFTDV